MPKPKKFPQQKQSKPGSEAKLFPKPEVINKKYIGSKKLDGKVAIITGGDSGIGRSIAVHFAREGANILIAYFTEDNDAAETKKMVQKEGVKCIVVSGDLKQDNYCKILVDRTISEFGKLDILINNAAVQTPQKSIDKITIEQLTETFETNVYPFYFIVKHSLPFLKKGSSIINTTSVTAYRGSEHLLDYSATKGAIVTFTRSLSTMLVKKGIRVNAVAPGPIWTPLIVSTFKDVSDFGNDTPMGRAGQPSEVAPAYVFLASNDSSYITGQVIHVNGGEMVGS